MRHVRRPCLSGNYRQYQINAAHPIAMSRQAWQPRVHPALSDLAEMWNRLAAETEADGTLPRALSENGAWQGLRGLALGLKSSFQGRLAWVISGHRRAEDQGCLLTPLIADILSLVVDVLGGPPDARAFDSGRTIESGYEFKRGEMQELWTPDHSQLRPNSAYRHATSRQRAGHHQDRVRALRLNCK